MTVGLPPGGDDDDDDSRKPSRKRKETSKGLADMTLTRRAKSTRTRRAPARRSTPAPVLSASSSSRGGREGPCGGFVRIRDWRVANPVQGLIIQKVTRTFAVERYESSTSTWVAISGSARDSYVTDPGSTVDATDTQYWEVWRVSESGAITPGQDRFALAGLVPAGLASYANTTKGTFTQVGEAAFYPTDATPASLGFAVGNVGAAGALASRTSDPGGDLTGRGINAVGGTVTYTVTSTWDSTWSGPPNTTDNPFIPPNANSAVTAA